MEDSIVHLKKKKKKGGGANKKQYIKYIILHNENIKFYDHHLTNS